MHTACLKTYIYQIRIVIGCSQLIGTGIAWEQLESCQQDIPPHLNVDFVDLSVPHLRPDFVDGIYFDNFSDYSDGVDDELDIFEDLCDDLGMVHMCSSPETISS